MRKNLSNKSAFSGIYPDAEADMGKSGQEEAVNIHSMPKRFITSHPSAHRAKGIGLMVIIGGLIIFFAAVIFFYLYLSKPKTEVLIERTEEATSAPMASQNQKKEESTNKLANNIGGGANETIMPVSEEKPSVATSTIEPAEATTTITKISAEEATSAPRILKPAVDSDKDGLADAEEVFFSTNANLGDTDGDGYGDLVEILNLYNPAGDGQIIVNDNIEKYTNNKYNYYLYYPKALIIDKFGGEDSVLFKFSNNQFIQVLIQPNPKKQLIQDWYKEQLETTIIKSSQIIYKRGWQGVKSEDELTFYLTKPNSENIFVLTYNLGTGDILYYKNIFAMMMRSLEISDTAG